MKRPIAGVGVVILLLASAAGAGYWRFETLFHPPPPKAQFAPPSNEIEAQRQDLEQFARLIALDRSFSSAARSQARARIAALQELEEALPPAKFRMELSAIVALADNAHSQLYSGPGGRANLIPIRAHAFSDGVFVLRADPDDADLLGARVTQIEGRPVEDVIEALLSYRGGTRAWRRNWAQIVLSSPELLYGASLASQPDRMTWRFERDGETVERTFEARKPADDEPLPSTIRWLSPEPVDGDAQDWRAFEPQSRPVTLTQFEAPFRRSWIGDSCVFFVQLKSNQDEKGESIRQFLGETRSEMEARRPCAVVLDMRFNGGGDYTTTHRFASDLASLAAPEGRIYILTGPDTFSAALTTVAFVEQSAPARVVILGEEVGDRLAFWSEGRDGCLPNAKLCVAYATGRHDYQDPCDDWSACYWVNYAFPVRVESLAPDEVIAWSFSDYAAGRDPAFERAMELAAADGA
jgi:hypothetical protein